MLSLSGGFTVKSNDWSPAVVCGRAARELQEGIVIVKDGALDP